MHGRWDNADVESIQNDSSVSIPFEAPDLSAEGSFVTDEKLLKSNLQTFTVEAINVKNNIKTAEFQHPFSCKVMGPRGSGKTLFTVSYINKIACLRFPRIYIATSSPEQLLYDTLKDNCQIFFVTLEELPTVVKREKDVLIVLDDLMKEGRNSECLQALYTKGRHERISIMSLEQDPFYSSHIERRNADYFVLTRMRDTSCLTELYKRFCRDMQQWRFIELYEYAVSEPLGYLIIDFVSHTFKYRINSLNLYYDPQTSSVNCIDSSMIGRELAAAQNSSLALRFQAAIANLEVVIESKSRIQLRRNHEPMTNA